MMMAIINMSFEEVKVDKHKFKSKFQLFEYIKRSARELYGSTYAKPIIVKYGKDDGSSSDHEVGKSENYEVEIPTGKLFVGCVIPYMAVGQILATSEVTFSEPCTVWGGRLTDILCRIFSVNS